MGTLGMGPRAAPPRTSGALGGRRGSFGEGVGSGAAGGGVWAVQAPPRGARPAPSAGSCALKDARAERRRTCAGPGWSAAATGRADSRAFRAGLEPSAPGARSPHPDPHLARDPDPDPARPGPRPRTPGRWTTPTSIRTTRAWRPWRRPPTATSAPAASPAASSTARSGPPSPRPGRPAPRSAPLTARLALSATTSPRPTRQVSPAPAQSSLQIRRNPQPLPYSAND